jgi:rod shape-determining protein MreB
MIENIDELDLEASVPSPASTPAEDKKRKMYVGLDLGTLQSCFVTKLTKPGSEEIPGELVPTVVGYPEDGILSGILPGNSSMLHGDEAISNHLHLRLVNPLSDGVVCDIDAARSFLTYLREKNRSRKKKRGPLRSWHSCRR